MNSYINSKPRIACVIVTYNRKQLLKRCLDAVETQSYKPVTVYITDNASTDGTIESVKQWGYYNCVKSDIVFKYILNGKNEGGAGGFYLGMKTAFEDDYYDGIWVMDDDGEPATNCLQKLVDYLDEYNYIAPIVLSDEDHKSCSFTLNHEDLDSFSQQMNAHDGIIDNWASPFNGILYSNKLIQAVGFPKKEMFIWGDEANYHHRAIKKGFKPYTILQAIHYHPLNRQEYDIYLGAGIVTNITSDWKLYCYLRNLIYNQIRVEMVFPKNIYCALRTAISNIVYYYKRGFGFSITLSAVVAGVFGYFGGLNKYFR